MKHLPDTTHRFLHCMGLIPEDLLILKLTNDGGILSCFDASHRAPDNLQAGADAEDLFPFLIGLFPLKNRILRLSNIEIQKGKFSNVYLFKEKDAIWVFIKDISEDMAHMSALIQEHNQNLFMAGNRNLLQKAREKSPDNERIIREREE